MKFSRITGTVILFNNALTRFFVVFQTRSCYLPVSLVKQHITYPLCGVFLLTSVFFEIFSIQNGDEAGGEGGRRQALVIVQPIIIE